jgi:hypothetical protein
MSIEIAGQVGPQVLADGAIQPFRQGRTGELISQQLHGRYYEQVQRGFVYSIGSGVTALSANTVTLTNSSTPIVGVWNPSTSLVNLVILQVALAAYANTLTTPVGPGAFVMASSVGNTAISTGSTPLNRKTLVAAGSFAKGFPGGVALTGLTNNVVIFDGLEIPTPGPMTFSTITTPILFGAGVVNLDGSLIIPPGGVLSILNTTSTTTFSVVSRLLWEEVPI